MEKYKNIADELKSKSEGLEVQVLTLKKVSKSVSDQGVIKFNIALMPT